MSDQKAQEWDFSYQRKDNYLYYPHEQVIRFISKYVRKRVGFDKFEDRHEFDKNPKVLDFGCGIGRHMIFLDDFKLRAYGFDLSTSAINEAKENFKLHNKNQLVDNVEVASILDLPYQDNEFSYMLSHGVLDSMPFEVAKNGMLELHRTLKKSGMIYFDVIGIEDSSFGDSDKLELTVTTEHEEGTIQSYFNEERILELLQDKFQIVELWKGLTTSTINNTILSRYFVVAKKV